MNHKTHEQLRESIESYMKMHIGFENGVLMEELLEIGFPERSIIIHKGTKREMVENWEYDSLKNKIRPILRRMRKDLDTFTIARNAGGEWVYFLINTKQEAIDFKERMESTVKGIRKTEDRAFEAVELRRY